MSGADAARELLDVVAGYAGEPLAGAPTSQDRPIRLATVAPGYAGTGAVSVTFDGEGAPGTRTYLALAPVASGDRVVMLPAGNTYVVLGAVGVGAWYDALVDADAALDTRLDTLEADSGWLTLALVNSWAVSGGLTPQYRKINGQVFIRGRVTGGSATTIATLPSGYRPAAIRRFACSGGGATDLGNVSVNADGTLTTATTNSPYLDVISFHI